jgi:hypothetical protein
MYGQQCLRLGLKLVGILVITRYLGGITHLLALAWFNVPPESRSPMLLGAQLGWIYPFFLGVVIIATAGFWARRLWPSKEAPNDANTQALPEWYLLAAAGIGLALCALSLPDIVVPALKYLANYRGDWEPAQLISGVVRVAIGLFMIAGYGLRSERLS